MPKRKKTNFIVIHCSATPPSMNIGAKTIRKWHMSPPRNWSDIAYAEVICRNGAYEEGRDLDKNVPAANEIGAHVYGFNDISVGVCMVGGVREDDHSIAEDNFTPEQFKQLARSLRFYKVLFPEALIVGHNELNPHKDCPSFDLKTFLSDNNLQ